MPLAGFTVIINPRRACAARVTVVVLCVCMYVCMCVCVSTHTCRLTHWNHKREIPTDSAQYRDRFKFCRFPKNASFKSYAYLEQLRRPSAFSPRNKLLCWFEAYSYVFTAQTMGLWKTACDLWHRLVKQHRYTDHEY